MAKTTDTTTHKIGKMEYDVTLTAERAVFSFKVPENGYPDLLASYINGALHDAENRAARQERDRLEREGGGVDPVMLKKIQADIAKLLERYDNRVINAAKKQADEVRAFRPGDEVILSKTCNTESLRGAKGVVKKRLLKKLHVTVGGKTYIVTPNLITKAGG